MQPNAKSAATSITSGLIARNCTRPDNSTPVQIGASGSERPSRINVNNCRRKHPYGRAAGAAWHLQERRANLSASVPGISARTPEEGNCRLMMTSAQYFIAARYVGEARQSNGDANAADVLARRRRRTTVL